MNIDFYGVNLISITTRLLLAVLCGGVIGFERSKKKRAAGFRTHILVCLGSALAMLTNQYIVETLKSGVDPARMGAQVLSGIGFLGAGTIIVTGQQQVKGLTTAAGLWACACMGLAIGIGFYSGAIVGCVVIVVVMTILQKVDEMCYRQSKVIDFYMELEHIRYFKVVIDYIRQNSKRVYSTQISKSKSAPDDRVGVLVTIGLNETRQQSELLEDIRSIEGVEFLEELG